MKKYYVEWGDKHEITMYFIVWRGKLYNTRSPSHANQYTDNDFNERLR